LQILATDKEIKEEILGIKWEPPQKTCLKKEDLPSYRAAVALIDEIFGVAGKLNLLHWYGVIYRI